MANSFRVTSDTGFYMIEGTLLLFGGYSVYLVGLELSDRKDNTLSIILFFTGLFFTGLGTYLYTYYQIVFLVFGAIVVMSHTYEMLGVVVIGFGIVLVLGVLLGALVKRTIKK